MPLNRSFIYLARNKKVDFYGRPDEIGHSNEALEMTQPVMTEPYQIGQLEKEPTSLEKTDFSLFVIQNQSLIFLCLAGYLFTLLAVFIFSKFLYYKAGKKLTIYEILICKSKLISHHYTKLKYILLAFSLFLFINLNLIENNIKTTKVVVDCSSFIDSISKFENTIKKPCFFREENNINLILKAPRNSFLHKSFKNKMLNKGELCNLSKNFNATEVARIAANGFDQYFFFEKRTTLLILLSYLARNAKSYFIFKNLKSYYQSLYVVYSRKSLETMKKTSLLNR